MTSAKISGGVETYQCTADNKRVSKIDNVGNGSVSQTIYIYGAMGEKLSVITGNGSAISNNIFFGGRMIKQGVDFVYAGGPTSPLYSQ